MSNGTREQGYKPARSQSNGDCLEDRGNEVNYRTAATDKLEPFIQILRRNSLGGADDLTQIVIAKRLSYGYIW